MAKLRSGVRISIGPSPGATPACKGNTQLIGGGEAVKTRSTSPVLVIPYVALDFLVRLGGKGIFPRVLAREVHLDGKLCDECR